MGWEASVLLNICFWPDHIFTWLDITWPDRKKFRRDLIRLYPLLTFAVLAWTGIIFAPLNLTWRGLCQKSGPVAPLYGITTEKNGVWWACSSAVHGYAAYRLLGHHHIPRRHISFAMDSTMLYIFSKSNRFYTLLCVFFFYWLWFWTEFSVHLLCLPRVFQHFKARKYIPHSRYGARVLEDMEL